MGERTGKKLQKTKIAYLRVTVVIVIEVVRGTSHAEIPLSNQLHVIQL